MGVSRRCLPRSTLPSLPERGPGVWKLNTLLLQDAVLCSKVRQLWSDWQLEKATFPSLAVWWDVGKARVKHLRNSAREKAKVRRSRVSSLERDVNELSEREAKGEDVSGLLKEAKDALELEHLYVAEGARIRAKE